MKRKDRQLGMGRDITRRDFLNGTSIAVVGSLLATPLSLLDDLGMVLARFLTPERIARGFGRGDAWQP